MFRTGRFLLATGCALLLTQGFARTTVEASCGDYLADHTERQMATAADALQTMDADAPTRRQRPCEGPSCRRLPGQNLPTPPGRPMAPDSDEHAALTGNDAGGNSQRDCACGDDPSKLPAGYPQGIERPPRTSSLPS